MITSNSRRVQYAQTSVAQAFAVPFYFLAAADLTVIRTRAGADTTLANVTDYAVTGAGTNPSTAVVTMVAGVNGDTVTIYGNMAVTQPTTWVPNDRFPAATTESTFDRLVMQVQQLYLDAKRALRLPISKAEVNPLAVVTWANKMMGFDANGLPTPSDPLGAASLTGTVIECTSYAALRAVSVSGFATGRQAITLGYSSGPDGGEGIWKYDSASAAADDNGTILAPTVGSGRWKRLYSGAVNPKWFGAKMDGVTADDTAIAAAVALVKPTGGKILLPEGILQLGSHFPIRQSGTPSSLEDYNGITIEGMGEKTIIRTAAANGDGVDVFQLNGVKNVNIRRLSVASTITGAAVSGSNAVSVTGGGENIIVEDVYANAMPYVDTGAALDGGSGFSIQQTGAALNLRNVQFFNCRAKGAAGTAGSYAINLILSGANRLTNPPQGVSFRNITAENCFRAVFAELTGTGSPLAAVDKMSVEISGVRAIDCQQGWVLGGMSGLNFTRNEFNSSYTGNPGYTSYDALKYALFALSCHHSNISDNIGRIAESDWFALVGGGYEGVNSTPSTFLNYRSNHFYGATTATYGTKTSSVSTYGYVTNSHLGGNTFESIASGSSYSPELRDAGATNVILSVDGSYFPSVVQSTFNKAREIITGWTNGGTPFGTLTVNANGHDITTLTAAAAGKFCGFNADLVVGRIYEIVASVSADTLIVFTNSDLGIAQDGSMAGIITTDARSFIFKAIANDNYVILKSAGAYTHAVTISLKEVPINVQSALWVENALRIGLPPIAADDTAAINAGVPQGGLYRSGADPDVLSIRH